MRCKILDYGSELTFKEFVLSGTKATFALNCRRLPARNPKPYKKLNPKRKVQKPGRHHATVLEPGCHLLLVGGELRKR